MDDDLQYCDGCHDKYPASDFDDSNNHCKTLCSTCNDTYDNKTGYCSLSCCLGGGCDDSC